MKIALTLAALVGLALASTSKRTVNASWYGPRYDGRATSSGQIFDHRKLTCASWDYPMGTKLRLRHGPRFVIVEVNDRGPAKHLLGTRQIDLSLGAFRRLADPDSGIIKNVEITVIEKGKK